MAIAFMLVRRIPIFSLAARNRKGIVVVMNKWDLVEKDNKTHKQFSPVGSGRLALALAEDRATAACYKAADEAMSGQTNVGSCVYFRTPIEGLSGIQIGGHIFY